MKKSILALSVLLLLLILTCLYEKTYVLYTKYHDNTTSTLATVTPITTTKKETSMVKVKEKEIIISKSEADILHKLISKQKASTTPVKQNDIEEIDTLMQALKEREDAFKNRDEFELHLQQLIKQALENRSAAIAHMNKEELHLLELQKELLKKRDIAYEKIGQTNTPTSGE